MADRMSPDDLAYLGAFLKEYQSETDRGAALVGAAQLDHQLFELLKRYFINGKESDDLLEGATAPLGTFSARILAAFCLGLISEYEFRELQLIRKVRNEFAHRTHGLLFADPKVTSLCADFDDRMPDAMEHGIEMTPRLRFVNAVIFSSLGLWNRAHYASKYKAEYRQWPY
jgi:mannitol operon repressor